MGIPLIIVGLLVAAAGLVLQLGGTWPRLPGDILVQRDGFTFYFPIVTSIVVSLVLTLIFRFFR